MVLLSLLEDVSLSLPLLLPIGVLLGVAALFVQLHRSLHGYMAQPAKANAWNGTDVLALLLVVAICAAFILRTG